jgi:type II secretory pathway pseudopilin PulG
LTLVEVLMALAIMGIGIVGLVASASRCLAVARKAKNYENARRLLGEAEMRLHEHLLEQDDDEALEEDSESWSFEEPFGDYSGMWEIIQIGEEEDTEGLYQLRMRISWSDKGKEAFEEVVTYLYAPDKVSGGTVQGTN